jgi:glucan phosphoethanolaminetransferase (alkaline phosphatase superfamily)
VRTCALCDWCLLKCSDTSSNTGWRPDTSSFSRTFYLFLRICFCIFFIILFEFLAKEESRCSISFFIFAFVFFFLLFCLTSWQNKNREYCGSIKNGLRFFFILKKSFKNRERERERERALEREKENRGRKKKGSLGLQ